MELKSKIIINNLEHNILIFGYNFFQHTCLKLVEFTGRGILELVDFFDSTDELVLELVLGLLAGNIGLCWLVVTGYKHIKSYIHIHI